MTLVAYPNADRPGADYRRRCPAGFDCDHPGGLLKPTKIFLSHPADHNPDHQALYLFTRWHCGTWRPIRSLSLSSSLVHYPKWPKHQD